MNIQQLASRLRIEENVAHKPYVDTVGKITIGVGRNLTDNGLRDDEIYLLLMNDIKEATTQLDIHLPWWVGLDEVRQQVLADMCFNMGIEKLLTFVNTLHAMSVGDYEAAAKGMENSLWDKQVKSRAVSLVKAMRTGSF